MALSGISSASLPASLRQAISRSQTELARAQKEALSSRLADPGLTLGARTAHTLALSRDIGRLGNIVDTNALATARLSASQSALGQLGKEAQSLLSALTAGTAGTAGKEALRAVADTTLATMTSLFNTALGGEYLFAGINTDVQPINAWKAGAPAKTAFDAAFQAHFGFAQTDAAAADISQADMTAFLDAAEDQFLGAGWNANWSNASDTPIQSRIALNETAATSVSANSPGAKKLAMASAILSDLLAGPVGEGARKALTARATKLAGEAVTDIAALQASTGVAQARVKNASERLETQVGLLQGNLSSIEGVDPYEASTRVANLLSQIEVSYTLTARIGQLSLAKFLP